MKSLKYFLVGMPASGKSTLGRMLAAQLGTTFIDLDKEIVKEEGLEITEIFSSKGEKYFRELERRCLAGLLNRNEGYVLATGGGAPCFFDNMEQMNNHGTTIFINVPVEDLHNKLKKKGTQKRPLLKDVQRDDLYTALQNKFLERKKYYDQSKICVDQDLGEVVNRLNQIIFAIKRLEEKSN
ncbi:MAG: shikimate kinase [Cytophagales bacterium]|nr:shikimate kinase [Cytophagales bacterium]